MFSMEVPKYWGNALLTACYLINRMSSWVLKYEAPIQVSKHCFPTSQITIDLPLRAFVCVCYVYISNVFQSKLIQRLKNVCFLHPTGKGINALIQLQRNFLRV